MKKVIQFLTIAAFASMLTIVALFFFTSMNPFELVSGLFISFSGFILGTSNLIFLANGKHSNSISYFTLLVFFTTVSIFLSAEFYTNFWNFSLLAHLFIVTVALLEIIPKQKNKLVLITRITTISTAILFGIILIAKLQSPELFGVLKILVILTIGFQIVSFFAMRKTNIN